MEIIKEGANYSAWKLKKITAEEFWQLSTSRERYYYLAQLAHLAANSHNTQPWKFKYSSHDDLLQLILETERVLPVSDIKGRQSIISIGCAMGNIEVAIAALGGAFEKIIKISNEQKVTNSENNIIVAEYRISKLAVAEKSDDNELMYHAIFNRRVDRGEYDHDRKIEASLLKKIETLGIPIQVKTILISDWGRKVALAELQAQADSFVINNSEFANELVKDWMLENNSDLELGMPGATFRLNSEQTTKIKTRFDNNLGFESDDAIGIAQLGKKGILSCQCVGMLTVDNDQISDWLNVGITLEKGALLFEAHGVAWAVHAGLAEVSQVNLLMLRPIAMTTKRPAILFRAGYLKQNESRSPHSPRLGFEKVWSE